MILQICAHLYGYTVESFGHKNINQVLCEDVFNAEDHINVVWRNFPLHIDTQMVVFIWLWQILTLFGKNSSCATSLISNLVVDPPVWTLSHAVKLN